MTAMGEKPKPAEKAQTPFERFTEAARHVFNIPKEKLLKSPPKQSKKRTSNRHKKI
jgi:hypothetical protein